jgi:hypothetical protein
VSGPYFAPTRKAVAARSVAPAPLMPAGSVHGGFREGKGPRRWSGRRRIEGGRGGGAGRPGRRAGGTGGWGAVRPGLGEEGGGQRWKTHLTGGSHLSARGREERKRWAGGFNWAGRIRWAAGKTQGKEEGGLGRAGMS